MTTLSQVPGNFFLSFVNVIHFNIDRIFMKKCFYTNTEEKKHFLQKNLLIFSIIKFDLLQESFLLMVIYNFFSDFTRFVKSRKPKLDVSSPFHFPDRAE